MRPRALSGPLFPWMAPGAGLRWGVLGQRRFMALWVGPWIIWGTTGCPGTAAVNSSSNSPVSSTSRTSKLEGGQPAPAAHTNRLAREKSPYLLQHQHNPVDWHPWGSEAFERARRENKPVFLS